MQNNYPVPFRGTFQSNREGPTIWVAVNAPIFEMMQGARHGITFEAPLSQDKDSLVGFTFVDDTGIVEVDLTQTEITIEDVYISMQKFINRREGVLKSTGRSIIPDK